MGRSAQRRPPHGPAVSGWTQRQGPGAVSGAAGPPGPHGPRSPGPRLSRSRVGGQEGTLGGNACWRAPPSALHARRGLLTKLHFEINSVAAGASEGYGCHGDRAVRGSPGMAGSGPGSGGATRAPQAILQGQPGPAGRIAFWALPPCPPPFCII